MSLAIKIMHKENECRRDMIIGGFEQNRKTWYKKDDSTRNKFPITVTQIQYCVQTNDCIKNITTYEREKGDML